MTTTVSRNLFGQLAEAILELDAKKATKILSPKLAIKATRRGKRDRRNRTTEILFTVGKPNYAERKFIKQCQKAKEAFPVKRILLAFDPGSPIIAAALPGLQLR